MAGFSEFYAQGGLFMHAVALTSITSGVQCIRAFVTTKTAGSARALLESARGYMKSSLGFGALGTLFGLHDVAAAIQSAPADQLAKALLKGTGLALTSTSFAFICVVPLGMALNVVCLRVSAAAQDADEY